MLKKIQDKEAKKAQKKANKQIQQQDSDTDENEEDDEDDYDEEDEDSDDQEDLEDEGLEGLHGEEKAKPNDDMMEDGEERPVKNKKPHDSNVSDDDYEEDNYNVSKNRSKYFIFSV